MSYQALYRKYRLQSFDDMVGQDHISNTIKNAIIQGKISHAYLFTGPRGTGKTSIAKLIARAINCEGDEVLCGKCSKCLEILANDATDIIEIDAASNNGVDEIRDIRDKVKYLPASLKYKVYIIDETHMLTTQAFNALLKTLEEPPKHVIFILATTEPHKIPLTILSRCQRFDFRKISEQALVDRLNIVVKNENISIDDDALNLISYLSDGGMRDALSLLDQVSSYLVRTITVEDVYNVTGVASKDAIESLIKAIIANEKISVLKILNDLNNQGKDLIKLTESLVYYLRDALAYDSGVKDNIVYYNNEIFASIVSLGSNTVFEIINYLADVLYKLRSVHNPKIYLEVAFVNLSSIIPENNLGFSKVEELNTLPVENTENVVFNEEKIDEVVIDAPVTIANDTSVKNDDIFGAVDTNPLFEEEEEEYVFEEVEDEEDFYNNEQNTLENQADENLIDNTIVEEVPTENIEEARATIHIVEDEVQPSPEVVLEVEQEDVITLDMIKKYYTYLRGTRINNALYAASKKVLLENKQKWEGLSNLDGDIDNAHLISILKAANLRASSDSIIILSVESEMIARKIMDELSVVESIVSEVLDVLVKVTVATENEWKTIRSTYVDKVSSGEKYRYVEEKTINQYYDIVDEEQKILDKAIDYFGESIVKER